MEQQLWCDVVRRDTHWHPCLRYHAFNAWADFRQCNQAKYLSPPRRAPTQVRAEDRPAIVVDHGWWRIVIHWPVDNLGALYHLRTLRSWPVGRRRGSARLRHAAAHVEC